MRCKRVRQTLEELDPKAVGDEVHRHLLTCVACSAHAREWSLLREGFRRLRGEGPPGPSVGFAERLLRRLEEVPAGASTEEFLVQVGRRVVYATGLLALILLLALVLPSSGPLRGPSTAEVWGAEVEVVSAGSDPIFAYGLPGGLGLPSRNGLEKNGEKQR